MTAMRIAVVGAGRRICGLLKGMCDLGVRVAAVADPDRHGARDRLTKSGIDHEGTRFVDDARRLLDDADAFDGFAIGTRCHLHAPMAVLVAPAGKPLFLEKPIAITQDQLDAVAAAWRGREDRVLVSFPLRVSPIFQAAREIIDSGRLGVINQIQAVNNVTYGDVYFASWYRRFEQVGGLWLQKATHDFDYLNLLVGAKPVRIAAMMTQRVFGTGRMLHPDSSPLPDAHRCTAPTPADEAIHDRSAALTDHGSRFHAAIRNQDAGSALIWYDNGVVVSYNQNFVPRRAAGTRGATVIGYNATLQWDWHPPEHIRVVSHDSPRVDRIDLPAEGGHGGGDAQMQRTFVDMMRGEPNTAGNLRDGLLSVSMCLAARKAAQNHTVEPIPDFGIYPDTPWTVDPAQIEAP